MLSFASDYTNGAHPRVLARLCDTNAAVTDTYGADVYSASAAEKIRAACAAPEATVDFLVGGTQTNLTVIAGLLRPWESVISAVSGHINSHEAGAVELTGHKVIGLPGDEGKLTAQAVEAYLTGFYADGSRDHMTQPGMVYISHPTEYGTLYTKGELTALSALCRKWGIPLYMDGARLAYGLAARGTDLTLPDIAALCDVFYIGGTKCGALCGEAVVFPRGDRPAHFFTVIKQHGALLAKGRLAGVQFDALFTDGLYYEIGSHAIRMAHALKKALADGGCPLFLDSPTNQQFAAVANDRLIALRQQVACEEWEPLDSTHTVVRFVTSWHTRPEDIDALAEILRSL